MYEFNSFIELNDHGGHVEIIDSVFERINSCGSIIRNRKHVYTKPLSRTSLQTAWIDRARNYPGKLLGDMYAEGTGSTYFTSLSPAPCSHAATAATPCFSLTIKGSTFINFGQLKTAIDYPNLVDPIFKLQYSGSVVDLVDFKGHVIFESNVFLQNIVRYASCRVADDMGGNIRTNFDPNDKYPNFASSGTASKNRLQIRSLISIVKQAHKVEIVKNDFQRNSGTKGIIYLDTYDRGTTLPVIIAHNTFTRNAGYLDASAVFIRARGSAVTTTIPNPGSLFCAGYHFESNIFTENFGCP